MTDREAVALTLAVLTILFVVTAILLAKRRRSNERGGGNLRINLYRDDKHGG